MALFSRDEIFVGVLEVCAEVRLNLLKRSRDPVRFFI